MGKFDLLFGQRRSGGSMMRYVTNLEIADDIALISEKIQVQGLLQVVEDRGNPRIQIYVVNDAQYRSKYQEKQFCGE